MDISFANDKNIISVVFGSQCENIDANAFKECISLNKINDNNAILSIGENAFTNTKLSTVIFNRLTNIDMGAFENCHDLKYVKIPNCSSIGSNAFKNCEELITIFDDNNEIIVDNNAFNGCKKLLYFPFSKCSTINDYAFYGCSLLHKLELNNCKSIGDYAFNGCENLTEISVSVCESIGEQAFAKCPTLSKVYINNPSNIKCSLNSSYTFCSTHDENEDCSINKDIIFYVKADDYDYYVGNTNWSHYKDYISPMPENHNIIYKSSDNKLIKLKSRLANDITDNGHTYKDFFGVLSFKNNIYYLEQLFEYPEKLTNIFIPPICLGIEQRAFDGCENLKDIILSNDLEYIDDFAFINCKSLNNISLPNKLDYIGESAFENCEKLTTFNIPESVTELGESIFAGCTNLEKIEGKFSKYDGRAIVYNNTLICVLPKDNSDTEGRICNISNIDSKINILGKSCFHGCEKLIRVDIPATLTEIHDNAFIGCKNIREIHFEGDEPPTIGKNIFDSKIKIFVPKDSFIKYYTTFQPYISLEQVEIYPEPLVDEIIYYTYEQEVVPGPKNENYITTTDISIFKGDTTITKVILGEGITKISEDAFNGCEGLQYIYLSDKITELNDRCFNGCVELTSIHIPYGSNNNTKIGEDIFKGCANLNEFISYHKNCVSSDNRCYIQDSKLVLFAQGNLTKYTIPNNNVITTINKTAFKGTNIQTIDIQETSITTIDEYAFAECTNLSQLRFPQNSSKLTTIGKHAFNGCSKMLINNIPDSVTTIGECAFVGCTKLKCVDNDNQDIEVPLKLNLTNINAHTFESCISLTEVEIKDSVTTIGDYAFAGCTKILINNIPDSVTTIGDYAFADCVKLGYLKFPQNSSKLTTIGKHAFNGCSKMLINNIPDSVTTIGDYAFAGCTNFKCADGMPLNLNITNINASTFESCETLTKVNIKDNVKTIGEYAFNECKELSEVFIFTNSSLSSISNNSFLNCTKLNTLNLPKSLKSIGNSAFAGCTNYKGNLFEDDNYILSFSSNLTSIGEGCFSESGIQSLNLNNAGLTNIPNSAFKNCTSLIKVEANDSKINKIGDSAFEGCKNLTLYNYNKFMRGNYIYLRSNIITYIGENAFYDCNFDKIYLSNSLKQLGKLCFTKENQKIYIPLALNDPPILVENSFGDYKQNENEIEIYVNTLKQEKAYKSAWTNYVNCIKRVPNDWDIDQEPLPNPDIPEVDYPEFDYDQPEIDDQPPK